MKGVLGDTAITTVDTVGKVIGATGDGAEAAGDLATGVGKVGKGVGDGVGGLASGLGKGVGDFVGSLGSSVGDTFNRRKERQNAKTASKIAQQGVKSDATLAKMVQDAEFKAAKDAKKHKERMDQFQGGGNKKHRKTKQRKRTRKTRRRRRTRKYKKTRRNR